MRRNGQDPDTYAPSDLFLKESVRLNGHKISFSSLDCQNAELTFRFGYSIGDCPGREITQNDLWEQKALMIYGPPGIGLSSVPFWKKWEKEHGIRILCLQMNLKNHMIQVI